MRLTPPSEKLVMSRKRRKERAKDTDYLELADAPLQIIPAVHQQCRREEIICSMDENDLERISRNRLAFMFIASAGVRKIRMTSRGNSGPLPNSSST